MENEKVNFEITRDVLSNDLKIFVKTEIIDKALTELKRTDKSNLAIIQDTIKILENGFVVPLEKINPGPGIGSDLAAALAAPLKAKPVPNSVEMGKVVLPDITVNNIADSINKSMNNNFMSGGMF